MPALRVKRQHVLLVGLLLFLAGVQFRLVDSFTLSERSSTFVTAQLGGQQASPVQNLWQNTASRKVVRPPRWLGLALMSLGSVMTLKSLSMRSGG